ncbi:hypothetical protein BG006_005002 [Podila minutissima]|uniref:Uncharacterized protein n=1 Tax=Podila minutissima TaxID=64525 RepID=A0A9P5SX07_9FUNG|nr:hypothetical protein BG006_005002 [Podila minutissima]
MESDSEVYSDQEMGDSRNTYARQSGHVAKGPSNPYTGPYEGLPAESTEAPFKIQSARGTPKGPLPIEVQISLLTSVLKHDPFNCAIRKTTQAWESISREQGIRARTCSRRFDNIIQASIAGRDRPMGTEEQIASKKRLLEKLFEMMNQPQALMRMQKKRRYRSEDADRQLLLETIRLNPFGQKVGQVAKAWEDVRDALKMKVHARQCIRRVNRMVKPYQLRERMYRGTIPDDMREANDDLVKQVINLMRQAGGGSLEDACNSNASSHDDSGSGMSDSDDQDEGYLDQDEKRTRDEDDELEEDDDEDMLSRSGSEKRKLQAGQVSLSPIQGIVSPTSASSAQPETPSLASVSISARSSTPTPTPAKRGRPRNSTLAQARHSRQSSTDRAKGTKMEPPVDVAMRESQEKNRLYDASRLGWESEARARHPNYPPDMAFGARGPPAASPSMYPSKTLLHGQPEAGPPSDHVYPGGGHPQATRTSPVQANPATRTSPSTYHHPAREHNNEYQRPIKHARTQSKGNQEIPMDMPLRPEVQRYGDNHQFDPRYETTAPPSAQQYHELVLELHSMRDALAQMDEQRRASVDKQGAMMYTIEALQQQMHRQQQQISQLQHQLRYGYPPSSSQHSPSSSSAPGPAHIGAPPTPQPQQPPPSQPHPHPQHHYHGSSGNGRYAHSEASVQYHPSSPYASRPPSHMSSERRWEVEKTSRDMDSHYRDREL